MRENVAGLMAGLVFGLGLCLSGLADPAVVQGFLDLAGEWNPALLFVMAAGVAVTMFGYRMVLRRGTPLWAGSFWLPTASQLDPSLIAGAAIFGVGWGLAGYCPGPIIVSMASGRREVFVFVLAMLAGMIAVRWTRSRPSVTIASPASEKRV